MDFTGTEQGGESIIFSALYKKYWEIGFKTRLYDGLSPEAYLESLQRVADLIRLEEGGWVLDAGCGSGLLLPLLADRLTQGGRYLGMDILPEGLASLKQSAKRLELNGSVSGVQADLSRRLPLAGASVSCVAAHFSVYTLPEENDRRRVYQELFRILKPGGLLVTANPTDCYNAKQIIRASLESLRRQGRPWRIKKLLVYPLTLHLGLKYIEKQLRSERWHGYSPEELSDDVARGGFSIEHSETVYGDSGFLVVGRKA
jgi:ubiquinone/menaquinone biosynthesis C-methylase UbiE